MTNEINGVINIYKEAGYTSHDVVAIVRKALGQKTGHTGTLDPEAEGVLPVCIGKATRLSDYIAGQNKTYECECVFGKATDTQDFTGKTIFEGEPQSTAAEIETAIMSFLGGYAQMPPMFSAVKVGGKKLYELARKGQEIERKARHVVLNKISIIDIQPPVYAKFSVECGKGTYIRTLCHDIGEKLGCGAYMASLTRTKSGGFTLENAVKLDKFQEIYRNGKIYDIIIPISQIVSDYRSAVVSDEARNMLLNGNAINFSYLTEQSTFEPGEIVSVYSEDGVLIGLYEPDMSQNALKPAVMLI